MERGSDRHHTADGRDPKSPCPAEAKTSTAVASLAFHAFNTLLGGSMLSAAWGDAREETRQPSRPVLRSTQRASPDLTR